MESHLRSREQRGHFALLGVIFFFLLVLGVYLPLIQSGRRSQSKPHSSKTTLSEGWDHSPQRFPKGPQPTSPKVELLLEMAALVCMGSKGNKLTHKVTLGWDRHVMINGESYRGTIGAKVQRKSDDRMQSECLVREESASLFNAISRERDSSESLFFNESPSSPSFCSVDEKDSLSTIEPMSPSLFPSNTYAQTESVRSCLL